MSMPPNLSTSDAEAAVAWYAEALATVHHLHLCADSDISLHLRVTPVEWTAIDDAWTAALTMTGVMLDPGLVLTFASTFARARQRLAQGSEQPSPLRELPTYLRWPPATSVESARPLAAPLAAAPVAATTCLASEPDRDDTIVPATLVSMPTLPFGVADPRRALSAGCTPCAMPTAPRAQAPRVMDGHETSVLGAFVPAAALPFAQPDLAKSDDDGEATMMFSAWSAEFPSRSVQR